MASLLHGTLSVTSTPIEVKVGDNRLLGRKYVVITPINGDIYFGSNNTVSISTGVPIFQHQCMSLEVFDNMAIWLVSSGTVDVRILERS